MDSASVAMFQQLMTAFQQSSQMGQTIGVPSNYNFLFAIFGVLLPIVVGLAKYWADQTKKLTNAETKEMSNQLEKRIDANKTVIETVKERLDNHFHSHSDKDNRINENLKEIEKRIDSVEKIMISRDDFNSFTKNITELTVLVHEIKTGFKAAEQKWDEAIRNIWKDIGESKLSRRRNG